MSEVAHFIGHDRKSTTGFPRARRFDRRIERQQIGLLGNAGDHLKNLADIHRFAVKCFDIGA